MPNEKVTTEQTEPYQQKIKAKHRKMKVRLIGKGKGPKAGKGLIGKLSTKLGGGKVGNLMKGIGPAL